jgi:hypothetical protein
MLCFLEHDPCRHARPELLSFADATGENMLLHDALRAEFSLASLSAAAEKYSRPLIGDGSVM